jgi:hypothetical protein
MAAAIFMWRVFSKRCKRCQTLYQSRMVRTMAVLLATSLAMPAALAKTEHCTLRVHVQANERDGSVFASPVTTPLTARNIFIEKTPTISERDVTAYRAYPAVDGTFGALFQLNDHGRLALETLSVQHRGATLLVLVNRRAVTELTVDRRVADGRLYLASGLSAADIALMEKDWPATRKQR